ncbi:hypothetical protein [Halobacterium litoreum]|uniref:Small CPxCG-related zinc finger protein n=1 Tax=Halobacterium litoreum TaxID=2039234 RepID=A0ABD5NCN9_9EURY|nr:hypothetical protein [Halobacterium litoreum]UHH14073.1 hypothetical protein LT972_03505 [Halobacterium litoreum]
MPACQHCGNDDRFVLSVECSVVLDAGTARPPTWTTSMACAVCHADDLA